MRIYLLHTSLHTSGHAFIRAEQCTVQLPLRHAVQPHHHTCIPSIPSSPPCQPHAPPAAYATTAVYSHLMPAGGWVLHERHALTQPHGTCHACTHPLHNTSSGSRRQRHHRLPESRRLLEDMQRSMHEYKHLRCMLQCPAGERPASIPRKPAARVLAHPDHRVQPQPRRLTLLCTDKPQPGSSQGAEAQRCVPVPPRESGRPGEGWLCRCRQRMARAVAS